MMGVKVRPSNVIVGILLLYVGHDCGQRSVDSEPQIITQTDTVTSARYAEARRRWQIESDGLRAQLADARTRPPERITVLDTIQLPPDTVFSFITIRDGELAYERLVAVGDLVQPALIEADVSDCDDGISVTADGIVCDRPRFGHLAFYLEAGTETGVGLTWQPTYRSGWRVDAGMTTENRMTMTLRRGWRLW